MNTPFELDLLFKDCDGICLKTPPKRSHNRADQADARLFALTRLLAKRAAHYDFLHCAHIDPPQGEPPHDITR